jgi:hypothetical protein
MIKTFHNIESHKGHNLKYSIYLNIKTKTSNFMYLMNLLLKYNYINARKCNLLRNFMYFLFFL